MAKPRLKESKGPYFSWIHIVHPTALETKELADHKRFLEEVDLKDVLPPIQRPKIIERDGYLFMILLFPVYNRENCKIHAVEVDFFIGKNFLITASSEELFPLSNLFMHCRKGRDQDLKNVCSNETPAELLYEILSRLEQYCTPISNHINSDIDKVENEMFDLENKKDTIFEVLRIKTNIVNFRKAINRQTHVLQKFLNLVPRFFAIEKLNLYFKDLTERSEDLWIMLENYQDTIDAIHESHLSLLNYRSNIIMQVFTIFTTIIFALELVISWVSFNTDTIPFSKNPGGFLIANAGLLLVLLVMALFFRKKKWI